MEKRKKRMISLANRMIEELGFFMFFLSTPCFFLGLTGLYVYFMVNGGILKALVEYFPGYMSMLVICFFVFGFMGGIILTLNQFADFQEDRNEWFEQLEDKRI